MAASAAGRVLLSRGGRRLVGSASGFSVANQHPVVDVVANVPGCSDLGFDISPEELSLAAPDFRSMVCDDTIPSSVWAVAVDLASQPDIQKAVKNSFERQRAHAPRARPAASAAAAASVQEVDDVDDAASLADLDLTGEDSVEELFDVPDDAAASARSRSSACEPALVVRLQAPGSARHARGADAEDAESPRLVREPGMGQSRQRGPEAPPADDAAAASASPLWALLLKIQHTVRAFLLGQPAFGEQSETGQPVVTATPGRENPMPEGKLQEPGSAPSWQTLALALATGLVALVLLRRR